MKLFLLVLVVACFYFNCTGREIPSGTMDSILLRTKSKDTIYVINFWATWCIPCVQELPEFDKLKDIYKGKPVRILLVSLDFSEDYPLKLNAFLDHKKMNQEVIWLKDKDANLFIPKVDKTWEGSIPATLIIQPARYRKFIEGQVRLSQLALILDDLLNAPK